ncbi:MAG: hypothetical protein MJ231_04070 [bacterium]|nr:hypothetical protein [bacterium]
MKKLFALIFLTLFFSVSTQAQVIEAGVSIEEVPKALFGSWSIRAKLDTTNSMSTFKPQSADYWTLKREGDIITLDNPYTGAKAEVSLKNVEGNLITFSRKTSYDNNKVLTDTVTIRIDENNFSGINYLKLESFSLVDNHLMKTENATYLIKGEKVAGDSILKTNN